MFNDFLMTSDLHLKESRGIVRNHYNALKSTLNEELENFDRGTEEGKEKFKELSREHPHSKKEFQKRLEQFLKERENLRISLEEHKKTYDSLVLESYDQFQIANEEHIRVFTNVHKVRLIEIEMVVCIKLNDTER